MYVKAQTEAAISQWLVSCLREPAVALRDWSGGRHAILRTGVRYDAVKMPEQLVHAAVGSPAEATVADALATRLRGPVIRDPGGVYYALVPPQTTETWLSPSAVVLGRGAWLGVPRPDRTEPPGLHWSVPVTDTRRVCDAGVVAEFLRVGRERCEDVRL